MSYILEALRKSERERRLGQVPSLPALDMAAESKSPRWGLWLSGLTLLLTANAAFLAVFWLQNRNAQPAVTAAAPQPAAKPESTPAAATPPQQALEQKVRELEKRLAKIDQPVSPPTAAADPAGSVRQQANPPAPPPPRVKPRRETAAAIPEAPAYPAERPGARRSQEESDDDVLPKAIKALKINVLAYSSTPGERFAVINMARHVPGDRLPGGVVLVDILPDGLSLELNGEHFRLNH